MKAVILAAGYGTRFLPATKTVPKELLPLIDKPAIAFIVDELVAAGVHRILIVSSRRKKALEDYFDHEVELESVFAAEGAERKRELIEPPEATVMFVRQQRMRGTGHALLQAEAFVGDEPFIVAYPDDLFIGARLPAAELVERYQQTGCSVLGTMHDPPELERYGVLQLDDDGEHVRDIVEKPVPGEAPSREASVGRYLYTPDIFKHLRSGWTHHLEEEGTDTTLEYFHTYALQRQMERNGVVYARCSAERLDTGSPTGYLQAIVRYASRDPRYRETLLAELARL